MEVDDLTHGDFILSCSTLNRNSIGGKKIFSMSSEDSSNRNLVDSPPELDQK